MKLKLLLASISMVQIAGAMFQPISGGLKQLGEDYYSLKNPNCYVKAFYSFNQSTWGIDPSDDCLPVHKVAQLKEADVDTDARPGFNVFQSKGGKSYGYDASTKSWIQVNRYQMAVKNPDIISESKEAGEKSSTYTAPYMESEEASASALPEAIRQEIENRKKQSAEKTKHQPLTRERPDYE